MKDTRTCKKGKQGKPKRGHLKHRLRCPCQKAKKQGPPRAPKSPVQRAIEQQKLNAMIAKARLLGQVRERLGSLEANVHIHV